MFAGTSDPLDINNRPPIIPAIDKDTCQLSSINVIVKELDYYTSPAEVEYESSPPRWRTNRFFVKGTVVNNWRAEKLDGPLHLPEDAFALHFLLEGSQRLVDVVVPDENLQRLSPPFGRPPDGMYVPGTATQADRGSG